jgi:repressor LexA
MALAQKLPSGSWRVYYYPDDSMLQLVAENLKYKPLVYQGEELNHIHILGKAVYFMSAVE